MNAKSCFIGLGLVSLVICTFGCKSASKKETVVTDTIVKKQYTNLRGEAYTDSVYKSIKGQVAPCWKMFNGSSKSIESFKDSVVLIEFTDPGCGACKSAEKYINEIKETNKNKNFKLCVICIDKTTGYLNGYKPKSMLITEGLINGKDIVRKYGVTCYPTFYLLNKKGEVLYMEIGYAPDGYKEMSELIERNL